MPKIYKLWVIQRDSGINLVDATFEEFKHGKPVDGLLMSGLITSFLMFSNEILGEGIRLIETPNYRLLFNLKNDLIVVLMMDKGGRVQFAEKILQRMQSHFVIKFRAQIDLSYQGDVTAFQEITRQIEEITHFKGIKLLREMSRKERESKSRIIHQKMQKSMQDLIQTMKD
ncbi:MAG: hypothetical protein ACTSVZ_14240 [Promethearchaeota archaeon]